MPITRKEFEEGKMHSNLEGEIILFLSQRKERAFTSKEIMGGLSYHTEFSTPEITKISTFSISDFTSLLYDLVKRERIKMRVVRNRMYFMMPDEISAKCPKCGQDAVKPRKTWKMAGRPNREGVRTQLHIGLYECSRHGSFRAVLEKTKISAVELERKVPKQKKKRASKKRVSKQKTRKKKTATKRSATKRATKKRKKAWKLI